jgi:hypothetical protein
MKKSLLIWLLFLWGFILTWCNEILDWDGMERDDNIPEWWERITVVTEMCEDQWWVVEQWFEWWDTQDVCYFDDKTFCYLEDFAAWNCKKWVMSYINDGVVYDYPPEDQLNWKPMEEAFCDYNNWVITENEYWDRFCTFSDWGYYELRAFKELWEMPSLRWPDEPYCSDFENIVCWTDWNGYINECWMKSAWVEEETELAEVVDGKCIYG